MSPLTSSSREARFARKVIYLRVAVELSQAAHSIPLPRVTPGPHLALEAIMDTSITERMSRGI